MLKGLMKLNDDELHWLRGRIGVIDVQRGCPVQCITCGVRAPKYSGSMPYEEYMIISESIANIKVMKNIDVLMQDTIEPYWSSDPMYYLSKDGKIKRSIYDIIYDINKTHHKKCSITTTGWNSGNNYMQLAAEDIIDAYLHNQMSIEFMYSIKSIMPRVMNEYKKYVMDRNSKKTYPSITDFIKESEYTNQIIENMKTLKPLSEDEENCAIRYSLQYIDNETLEKTQFKEKYELYSNLFSEQYINILRKHLISQDQAPIYSFGSRKFVGIGKALDIGIEEDKTRESYKTEITSHSRFMKQKRYNVQINGYGDIEIYYGKYEMLDKILVPKEHFQIMAEKSFFKSNKEKYKMLTNLQGKNLLE